MARRLLLIVTAVTLILAPAAPAAAGDETCNLPIYKPHWC